mgnify:CR=1 FL=1
MPEISVLMSVYNGEEYIKETIDCILDQSYQDFEFIIINDGSTDDTESIIKSFHDPRIRYFKLEKNSGVGKALNYGLQQVRGKYIAKADADDLYSGDRLAIQKKFLDDHQEISLVGSFIEYFPNSKSMESERNYLDKKNIWEKRVNTYTDWKDIQKVIYWYCCVIHSSVMIRSEVLKEHRYKEFPMSEDYDLFYRLNKAGHRMAIIDRVLTRVRVHEKSTSIQNIKSFFDEILFEIKKFEIQKLFENINKVYIWGAGSFGEKMLEVLNENDLDICGFIDSNHEKEGKKVRNKEVFSPGILKPNLNKVIVASQPGMIEIVNYLQDHGFVHLKDFVVC